MVVWVEHEEKEWQMVGAGAVRRVGNIGNEEGQILNEQQDLRNVIMMSEHGCGHEGKGTSKTREGTPAILAPSVPVPMTATFLTSAI